MSQAPGYLRIATLIAVAACPMAGAELSQTCLDQVKAMVPLVQAAKNTPLAAGQSQADAVEGVLRDNLDLSACMIDALPEDTRAGLAKSLAVAMEANRVDTQTGAGASAAGSTTLVSSGQTARLIGLAVEQGGILQSISGSIE